MPHQPGTHFKGPIYSGGDRVMVEGEAPAPGSVDNDAIAANAAIDASKIADGSVSSVEYQYLNGATSNIQDQIDALVIRIEALENA